MSAPKVRIAGLWIYKAPSGEKMLCGRFGFDGQVMVLPNRQKKTPKQPDYWLWFGNSETWQRQMAENWKAQKKEKKP